MRLSVAWRLLPLVAVLLLTSGCLRLRGELAVSPDGLVSGTVMVAVKVPAAGGSPLTVGPVPAGLQGKVSYEPYSADGFQGSTIRLRGVTFAELDRVFQDSDPGPAAGAAPGPGGLTATLSMRRDGDRVVTTGQFSLPSSALLGPQDDPDFEARIRISYPGDVVSTNGRQDGRTVTWTLHQFTAEQIRATAYLDGSRSAASSPWLRWGGSGLAALLLLGAALWLWTHRSRPAPAGPPPAYASPPWAPSGPGAGLSGPGPWGVGPSGPGSPAVGPSGPGSPAAGPSGPGSPGWGSPGLGPSGAGLSGPGAYGSDDSVWARPEGGDGPGLGIPPGERGPR